jgi:hypothetical protein
MPELIPNVEKIAADYLREHPDIAALCDRVVSKTPDEQAEPWIRYTQLTAGQERGAVADRLVDAMVQFDCYAGAEGGQPEAALLGRTVRAVLQAMPGIRDEVVVSACRILGHARIPDTDFKPARERVVITAEIYMHS